MTTGQTTALEKGGSRWRKLLAASVLAAALAIPTLVSTAAAADNVTAGRTIEAFTGTNLVNVQNYPANRSVTIAVLRNGVLVSSVTGKTDATGFAEFNHVGGGQVSKGGDCFKPPVSPDIMPGDTIRTRTAGDPAGRFDRAVVRDIEVDFETIAVGASTITISGRVNPDATAATGVAPGTDILELRLNKGDRNDLWDTGPGLDQDRPGRRDLRVDIGENVQPGGTWTRVLNVGSQDAQNWENFPGEVSLEWSEAPPAGDEEVDPPAIFVADEAEGEALLGCPPFAENAVTMSNPKVINKANVGKGLRLAGISKDASAVSVTLDDNNAATAPIELAATRRAAYVAGFQTWRTDAMTARQLRLLGLLKDGRLTARATYTIGGASVSGVNLRILKDTIAPAKAPSATPRPGFYPRTQLVTLDSQPGTVIRYTLNGKRPTANSPVYRKQIKISKTRTIKAISIDRAGNRSPVGVYRYVIR